MYNTLYIYIFIYYLKYKPSDSIKVSNKQFSIQIYLNNNNNCYYLIPAHSYIIL